MLIRAFLRRNSKCGELYQHNNNNYIIYIALFLDNSNLLKAHTHAFIHAYKHKVHISTKHKHGPQMVITRYFMGLLGIQVGLKSSFEGRECLFLSESKRQFIPVRGGEDRESTRAKSRKSCVGDME